MRLVRAEFGVSNKVVQGAPYSAQAVTQFTQTLANGDHIQRTTTASIARDSQGRTRMDRSIATVGALSATAGGHARAIMIHDPVAGMSYALDPASKTGTLDADTSARGSAPSKPARAERLCCREDRGPGHAGDSRRQRARQAVTRAIPAGQEGNEKEIDIVTETWYSPDLQVVVMSKTSDPRFGETVYQLSGLSRAEPDPALFTVPSDYTVTAGRPMMRRGPEAAQ